MKIKKRIIAAVISVIAAISIMMGGVFCSADDVDFGTFEDGIYDLSKKYWYHRHAAYKGGDGLPNGDFQQGYKYWIQNFGMKCSDVTTLKKEGDNYYLHFDGQQCQNNYDGINSVRFTAKNVTAGTPLAVLYKWRGDSQYQIYLSQWDMNAEENGGKETRLSFSAYTKKIYEAYEEGEWNIGVTSAADGTKSVTVPTQGSNEYFFSIGVQITTDPTVVIDFDDIQLVIRQDNGIVTDLDGNKLYDLNNLETRVIEETDIDLSDFDLESKKVEMPGPSGMTSSSVLKSAEKEQAGKSEAVTGSAWFWVVVSAGVVIIIAAVVVIVVLLKKKKASDGTPDVEVSAEPNDVSDETEEKTE